MKKKFFSVVLTAVLAVSCAQAQFSLGLNAGVNSTKVKSVNVNNTKKGLKLGLIGEYALSKNLAIHSGILYDYMAISYTFNHHVWQNNIDFLQIPLNIQYNLDLGVIVPFLHAGPNYFFNVGQPEKGGGLGCNLGGGLQFGNIQLGYNIGFYNKVQGYTAAKINLTNHTIGLTYFFGGKRRPSSNRKYSVPKELRNPYSQTVNVANTPARDISKKVRLHQINQSPYNTINPIRTENDQMGYSIGIYKPYRPGSAIYTSNNYQLFINQDQLRINTIPVVGSEYITASRRNRYNRKLKNYNKRYNANVENLKSYIADLSQTLAASQITDDKFEKLMEIGFEEYENEQFEKAEEYYYKAAIARPNNEDAVLSYGICLYENEKYLSALSVYKLLPNNEMARDYAQMCERILEQQRQKEEEQRQLKELQRQQKINTWMAIGSLVTATAATYAAVQSVSGSNSSSVGSSSSNTGGCNCSDLQSLYTRAKQRRDNAQGTYGNAGVKEDIGAWSGGRYGDNSGSNAALKSSAGQSMRVHEQEIQRLQRNASKCGCTLH